jgi:PIN domain nuclease of toxin-antitoxin system
LKLLIDTHVLLWTLTEPEQIGRDGRKAIEAATGCFVSVASIWEIAIKQNLGKLRLPSAVWARFVPLVEEVGFAIMPIDADHAVQAGRLPHLHRDPFDRLLIAQAQSAGLTLVSRDERLAAYGVQVIAA